MCDKAKLRLLSILLTQVDLQLLMMTHDKQSEPVKSKANDLTVHLTNFREEIDLLDTMEVLSLTEE